MQQFRTTYVLAALALLAAVYVFVRGALIPFSWDESFTWLEFVRGDNWWPENIGVMSANNHLLNTWLMKATERLFGSAEFSLRLPNMLGGLLYLWLAYRFAAREAGLWKQLAVFVLLTGYAYLLDFFSIARGYGLSNALMLAGFWMYRSWCRSNNLRDAFVAQLLLALAVLANLALIHVLLGASVAAAVRVWFMPTQRMWEGRLVRIQFLLLPLLGVLAGIVPYSLKLKAAGALFFGAQGSWFRGTWRSLIDRMLYGHVFPPFLKDVAAAFFLIVTLAGISAAAVFAWKQLRKQLTPDQHFLVLLAAAAAAAVFGPLLQSRLVGTLLLSERTALFYVPLLMLLFVQLLHVWPENRIVSKLVFAPALPALLLLPFTLNFSYQRDWPDERHITEIVNELHKRVPQKSFVLAAEGQFLTDLNYQQSIGKLSPDVTLCEIRQPLAPYPWLLVFANDRKKYPGFRVRNYFGGGRIVLMENTAVSGPPAIEIADMDFEKRAYKQPVRALSGKGNVLFGGAGEVYPLQIKTPVPDSLNDAYIFVDTEMAMNRGNARHAASVLYYIKRGQQDYVALTDLRLTNYAAPEDAWITIKNRQFIDQPVCAGDTLVTQFFIRSESLMYFDNLRIRAGVVKPR
ncbi:MAG: hypothetical protein IM638_04730 [Bacteroidetes bacterium]|nr:hypothetical protein [Bacteroidota bacterium]